MAEDSNGDGTGGAGPPGAGGIEGVALIHGLARSTGSLWPLAVRLEAAGYRTVRIAYPSTRLPIAAATAHVAAEIGRRCRRWGTIHLVGHSLGGVIARRIAEGWPDLPIGRVVQLGSPNAGSAVAGTISRLPGAETVFGPALSEIARLDRPAGPHPEVGALAGHLPLSDRLARVTGLEGPNDGLVTVRSALAGARRGRAIASLHGWLPLSPRVGRLVLGFLRHGRFVEQS